jgi:hypothetical protein
MELNRQAFNIDQGEGSFILTKLLFAPCFSTTPFYGCADRGG